MPCGSGRVGVCYCVLGIRSAERMVGSGFVLPPQTPRHSVRGWNASWTVSGRSKRSSRPRSCETTTNSPRTQQEWGLEDERIQTWVYPLHAAHSGDFTPPTPRDPTRGGEVVVAAKEEKERRYQG
eukprot:Hpha_TRINITY_DN20735_c0_g1::TRINITY_DN20735_c0_g1_i1::g.33478::m.33478